MSTKEILLQHRLELIAQLSLSELNDLEAALEPSIRFAQLAELQSQMQVLRGENRLLANRLLMVEERLKKSRQELRKARAVKSIPQKVSELDDFTGRQMEKGARLLASIV